MNAPKVPQATCRDKFGIRGPFRHDGAGRCVRRRDRLGRTGLEAEAAWRIELPLALAAGGKQLFSYVAPAARYSKLRNRFANLHPTPEPSLAWDWEKIDGGIRLGLWAEVDLTVEYSYNRIYLNPQLYRTENEALGTLRIRL
jgi:hypothetical protein